MRSHTPAIVVQPRPKQAHAYTHTQRPVAHELECPAGGAERRPVLFVVSHTLYIKPYTIRRCAGRSGKHNVERPVARDQ
eukprot:4192621-Prymnesium_polylepis.1